MPLAFALALECLLLFAPLAAEAQAPARGWRVAVLAGGLARPSAPIRALEERLAELGYQALKGARPGTLPIAQATKFDLVINLATGRTLSLVVPPSLLLRADRVLP